MSKNNSGTIILWIFIGIAIIVSVFLDARLLLLFGGSSLVIFGLLNIFSKRFSEGVHKLFGESELDKKVMSEKDRYLTRRYFASFRLIILGIILLWVFSWWHQEIFSKISGWFQ